MLTNIFYYNYYKPYMVNDLESSSTMSARKEKIADKKSNTTPKNQLFILNKTLKNDVVRYANDISNNLVSLKDSSKNLVQDMEDYNKNVRKHGNSAAKEWIAEDLQDFVNTYNSSTSFMSEQKHSATLKAFSAISADKMHANQNRLAQLGISFGADEKLSFNNEVFRQLNDDNINVAIGEGIRIIQDIYEDTAAAMQTPMSEHMNFRGLNYHYNYKMGTIISDTFNMIESGLIIDRVV